MLTMSEWMGLISLVFAVLSTIIGFGIKALLMISAMQRASLIDKAELMESIASMNNTFIALLNMKEDTLGVKISAVAITVTTLELYVERMFLSKRDFDTLILRQSNERTEMKNELLTRMQELNSRMQSLQVELGKVQKV